MPRNFQAAARTVAVTGLHRGDSPQPGAAVISSLRRRFPALRMIGLSYDPLESALYSHGSDRLDAAYLLPYPRVGAEALLERLDKVLGKERIDFVIPCLDSEIMNFVRIETELAKRGLRCALPTKQSFERRSKQNLYPFCQQIGVPAPLTRAASDARALADYADEIGYPLYVKGRFYDAHLVNSRAELYAAFDELARSWGPPVLVQESALGEEYDVVGLGDGKGRIIGSCSIRKMLRTSAGKGFAGVVVVDPRIDELADRIIRALRWHGPFELEFIKSPGKPHALFEINPRFPAWVDFPSQIGCNLPARLLDELMHVEPAPLAACPAGRMFIRHSVDLLGDIGDLATMTSAGERLMSAQAQS